MPKVLFLAKSIKRDKTQDHHILGPSSVYNDRFTMKEQAKGGIILAFSPLAVKFCERN